MPACNVFDRAIAAPPHHSATQKMFDTHVGADLVCLLASDENGGSQDLAALHRSYKMMENDKVRYMEESKNIIKRQTQV